MEKKKTALVLAGPSGGGKTTVMKELLKERLDFELVRSATTRARRGDGNDGEYLYFSKEEFSELVKCGKMLEFTEYGGNFYGTPRTETERIIREGKTPILILDINGVSTLKTQELDFDIYSVYIYAEPRVLSERLLKRYSDSGKEGHGAYISRMKKNREDYERAETWKSLFDTAIPSTTVFETATDVLSAYSLRKKDFSPSKFTKMAEEFDI